MARYIDADELLKAMEFVTNDTTCPLHIAAEIDQTISLSQTSDVEEVKHGHWIKTDRGVRKNLNTGQTMRVYAYDCSCCGWHTGNQGAKFKRCPMCGAKMDGDKEGEKL